MHVCVCVCVRECVCMCVFVYNLVKISYSEDYFI